MTLRRVRFLAGRLWRLADIWATTTVWRERAIGYIGLVGYDNLGDEAMFIALRQALSSKPLLPSPGPRPVERRAWHSVCRRKALGGCILGGGTMVFSEVAYEYLASALDAGLPCWVLGTGVRSPAFWAEYGPGRLYSTDKWAQALRACRFVGVRGPLSARYLEEAGFSGAEVIGDPALLLAGQEPAQVGANKVLGINWRTSGNLVWGRDEETPRRELAGAVRKLLADGWQARLFCVWPGDLAATEFLRIELRLPHSAVVSEYTRPERYFNQVAGCSAFLGMKLHAVALALCAGVPALMVEYRPKCRDFMASVGLEGEVVRLDRLEASDLASQVQSIAQRREEVRTVFRLKTGESRALLFKAAQHAIRSLEGAP